MSEGNRIIRVLLERCGSPAKRGVHHILRVLVLNDDATWWEGKTDSVIGPISWYIGGEGEPDPTLLEQARSIFSDLKSFEAKIFEFLNRPETRYRGYEGEIDLLRIETIALFWPKKPMQWMIFFMGPDQYRLWRCSVDHGEPCDLGFDD